MSQQTKAVIALTSQPASVSMDLYRAYHAGHDEKLPDACSRCPDAGSHQACHKSRARRLIVPALISLLASCALLFVACMNDFGADFGMGGSGGLTKRQSGGSTGNTGSGGSFVHNKLYLIIVFVGLFIVLILGIMLSAWCCRGSFENPLCCPCYLCACCGGLACLECIGCGLCAEGLEQV